MPELPDRPDLGQLRSQARELLRDVGNGEPAAAARLRAVSDRVALSAAQLAVARGYGHRSWAALKADVQQRPAGQPFFVTLLPEEAGRAASGASVRDARTGAVTARLKPPAGESFSGVTAAGPGTFLLAAYVRRARGGTPAESRASRERLYRLQVDGDGRAVMTLVPGDLLPPDCHDVAASADGTVLAYTVKQMPGGPPAAQAGLVDTATGERRAASLPEGSIRDLSLSNDGQAVAFRWQPEAAPDEVDVHVAPAAAADWVAAGSKLTGPAGEPYDAGSPVISADGRAVYITVVQPEPTGGPRWTRLLEVPAGGGQARTVFELRHQPQDRSLAALWGPVCRNRGGDQLLAFADGYAYRIGISSGAVTRLPFPEGEAVDAAW